MTSTSFSILPLAWMLCAALLSGCAANAPSPAMYDLGPARVTGAPAVPATLPPISIGEPETPAWLDTPAMMYRLSYANDQQVKGYAGSRWSMPPVQLFTQRLRTRLAQAGATVLSGSDTRPGVFLLRIDADDFSQNFTSPEQSQGQVSVRVSVLANRTVVAQQTFSREAFASSADAPGGARALAVASDAVIDDVMAWLAQLPIRR